MTHGAPLCCARAGREEQAKTLKLEIEKETRSRENADVGRLFRCIVVFLFGQRTSVFRVER